MTPTKPASKLTAFAFALAAVFGLATLAGAVAGPDRDAASAGDEAESEHGVAGERAAADPVRGLAVSDGALTLALEDTELQPGRPGALRFRILERDGAPLRDFDVEHERRMHLIVVRRDGSGFQHLHPELAGDGTWSTPLTLADAGAYRVFADFSHDGENETLAADVTVDGDAAYEPLPDPATRADTADGYSVVLDPPRVAPGREAQLEFSVTRDGQPVDPEPYLGARGHLVALREGDLAYLHVHADEDSLAFMAEFPSAGRYRLYLQFRHAGRVHTAEFTQEVPR